MANADRILDMHRKIPGRVVKVPAAITPPGSGGTRPTARLKAGAHPRYAAGIKKA